MAEETRRRHSDGSGCGVQREWIRGGTGLVVGRRQYRRPVDLEKQAVVATRYGKVGGGGGAIWEGRRRRRRDQGR